MTRTELKRAAARRALSFVESGMVLGLGTGSTVEPFVELLGSAVSAGELSEIVGIATSVRTAKLAERVGIRLTSLSGKKVIDLTVDGADEVAPGLDLTKGLGGALLREKMVARASRRFVVVADDSKLVERLGRKAPLPVEVIPWEHEVHVSFFEELGAEPRLRMEGREPYRTDNGNFIYHLAWAEPADPVSVQAALAARAGVVESGFFLGMADFAVVAGSARVELLRRGGGERREELAQADDRRGAAAGSGEGSHPGARA